MNYVFVNEFLASVDWDGLLVGVNVNTALERFYDVLNECFLLYVPVKRIKKTNFPKWFNPELKNLVLRKKILHKNYLESSSLQVYNEFSEVRRQCKLLSEHCHNIYLENVQDDLIQCPKNFWKFVNEKRKCKDIPSFMHFKDSHADNGQSIVNLFSQHFSSVYNPDNCQVAKNQSTYMKNISFRPISLADIFEKNSKLPNKMSVGPDNIPNIFLKMCVYTISKPLSVIFNSSISQETFPDFWKRSFIIPIFKSGDPEDIQNYRGVCNQCTLAKVLDSLVYDQLSWECSNIISENQHGFCPGRSTTTNLVGYEIDLLEALERGSQIDSIYTDFSKAFDRVNFDILISKLNAIGFNDGCLRWISSFLRGRSQCVKVKGFESDFFPVHSGVPQGSHCAPLLFNLFINDLGDYLKYSTPSFYADDLKLYKEIRTVEDSIELQRDMDALWEWSQVNNLNLNIKKCFFISFYHKSSRLPTFYNISNTVLRYEGVIKDLGVWFNERVDFNDHALRVSQSSMKILGFVYRNCRELSVDVLRCLYISLVRSKLEYASVVWSPYYQTYIDIIERVQNRFLRIMAYKLGIDFNNYHRADVLQQISLVSLRKRRQMMDACFVFKVLHGQIKDANILAKIGFNVPCRALRRRELFHVEFHRVNYGINSPINRTLHFLNEINDIDIFNLSLDSFKVQLLNAINRI